MQEKLMAWSYLQARFGKIWNIKAFPWIIIYKQDYDEKRQGNAIIMLTQEILMGLWNKKARDISYVTLESLLIEESGELSLVHLHSRGLSVIREGELDPRAIVQPVIELAV